MEYQLVLCTCPNTTVAKEIAECLVNAELAACVNIIPNIMSVYRWQGKIECDQEVQLMIKTTSTHFNQITDKIRQLHPYDTPEIIALNIQQGDERYLNWIKESLK